eukprot:gene12839-27069_t
MNHLLCKTVLRNRTGKLLLINLLQFSTVGCSNILPHNKYYHVKGDGFGAKCSAQTLSSDPTLETPGFVITTDSSVKKSSPTPIELFLASLCGCEQATASFVARNMTPRMKIEKIEFDIQGVRDELGAISLPLGQHEHKNPSAIDEALSENVHPGTQLPLARLQRIWG